MEKCKCCEDKKSTPRSTSPVHGFNRLGGESFKWATENGLPRSEYCVYVRGGKRFGGPDWVKKKCGDGRTGFSTRRRRQDEALMVRGLDGQFKPKRNTIVRRKSARSTFPRRARRIDGSKVLLFASSIIIKAQRDPVVEEQRRRSHKKFNRAENRNNRARRGHKRAIRAAA